MSLYFDCPHCDCYDCSHDPHNGEINVCKCCNKPACWTCGKPIVYQPIRTDDIIRIERCKPRTAYKGAAFRQPLVYDAIATYPDEDPQPVFKTLLEYERWQDIRGARLVQTCDQIEAIMKGGEE